MAQGLKIEIPKGIDFSLNNGTIRIKGPKGEIIREFPKEYITISFKEKTVEIFNKNTSKSRAMAGTFYKHILNMIKGVQEEFVYILKICFSHFPITVELQGDKLLIKNFLGGSKAREIKVPSKVSVDIKNKLIEIRSIDKELAGSFAGNIEQKTRSRKKDLRVFQDGIYLISKAGKEI